MLLCFVVDTSLLVALGKVEYRKYSRVPHKMAFFSFRLLPKRSEVPVLSVFEARFLTHVFVLQIQGFFPGVVHQFATTEWTEQQSMGLAGALRTSLCDKLSSYRCRYCWYSANPKRANGTEVMGGHSLSFCTSLWPFVLSQIGQLFGSLSICGHQGNGIEQLRGIDTRNFSAMCAASIFFCISLWFFLCNIPVFPPVSTPQW